MTFIRGKRNNCNYINMLCVFSSCVSRVFPVFPRNAHKEHERESNSKLSFSCVSRFLIYKGNAEWETLNTFTNKTNKDRLTRPSPSQQQKIITTKSKGRGRIAKVLSKNLTVMRCVRQNAYLRKIFSTPATTTLQRGIYG